MYKNFLKHCNEKNPNIDRLFWRATHDYLTCTLNRYGFELFIKMIASKNEKEIVLSVVDIDNLSNTNDAFGHCEGDWAIKNISKILINSFERNGVVCRWGGDEFIVIYSSNNPKCILKNHFLGKMDRVREKISEAFKNKGYPIGLSYGFSIFTPQRGTDINSIIDVADKKMYSYKMFQKGKLK